MIHGDADPLVRIENGRFLAERVPGARLIVYEGIGHMPFWESFERFNSELGQFVSRVNEREPRRSKDGRLAPDAPDVA